MKGCDGGPTPGAGPRERRRPALEEAIAAGMGRSSRPGATRRPAAATTGEKPHRASHAQKMPAGHAQVNGERPCGRRRHVALQDCNEISGTEHSGILCEGGADIPVCLLRCRSE